MIVVDTSALVAIVKAEPERMRFLRTIEAAGVSRLCTANYVEASLVCEDGERAPGRALFDQAVAELAVLGLELASVDRAVAEHARDGFRRFGKGRHAARLNFGDCFAYGLAKALDAPLLFKGEDFAKTDIGRA